MFYANRGLVFYCLGMYDWAIGDYNSAIELYPLDSYVFNDRSEAWASLNEYDKVIGDFDKALEINSNNIHAYAGKSLVLSQFKMMLKQKTRNPLATLKALSEC